jgi:hypothetical protein
MSNGKVNNKLNVIISPKNMYNVQCGATWTPNNSEVGSGAMEEYIKAS